MLAALGCRGGVFSTQVLREHSVLAACGPGAWDTGCGPTPAGPQPHLQTSDAVTEAPSLDCPAEPPWELCREREPCAGVHVTV